MKNKINLIEFVLWVIAGLLTLFNMVVDQIPLIYIFLFGIIWATLISYIVKEIID